MLNIVIPLAGLGSRFTEAGYTVPKPFIDVAGKPMIQRVVANLLPHESHRFIFIARREHEELIKDSIEQDSNCARIVYVDEVTDGAACTVLLARYLIDNDDQLIIANSDQLCMFGRSVVSHNQCVWKESDNISDFINNATIRNIDASICTFHATHPKWSYAKITADGLVERVAEKKVISNHATVGIYYFKHGRLFVNAALKMIRKNIRTNNEFYVCPVFNEMVDNYKIGLYPIRKMVPLGTPEDLENYLNG